MSEAKFFEAVYIKEEPDVEVAENNTGFKAKIVIEIEPCEIKQETVFSEGIDVKIKELNKYLNCKPTQISNKSTGSQQYILPDIKKSELEDPQTDPSLIKESKVKKRYECYICHQQFTFPVALRRHIDIHNGTKLYQCDICDKKFARKTDVSAHLRIHNGDKPYSCHFCGRTFANLSNRRRHIDVHTNAKVSNCNVCGKTIKCNLKAHLRTHDTEKPYKCHICEKQFTMKNNLNFHVRLHSGEKPFSCEICKKNFAEKFTLKRHLAVHSKEKPYPCGVCNKRFRTKYALSRHLHVHDEHKPKRKKAIQKAQKYSKIKQIQMMSEADTVKRKTYSKCKLPERFQQVD